MKKTLVVCAVLASQLFLPPCYAVPGDIDPSFGIIGRQLGPYQDVGTGCALQPDGKLLVTGRSAANSGFTDAYFGVIRHNSNGTPDTGFGPGTGAVLTQLLPFSDQANALVVQPDGKIVAGGLAMAAKQTFFALARYLPSGSLDTTFGAGAGTVMPSFGTNVTAYGMAVAMQPDGKIVVAGDSSGTSTDYTVARYNSDGTLDSGFGTGGVVRIAMSATQQDTAQGVVIQPDGGIVVVGIVQASNSWDIGLARLTSSGALDPTFGTGGKVITALSTWLEQAYAAALQPDGKVVVAGTAARDNFNNRDLIVLRYNVDGSLDTTFNGTGSVRYVPASGSAEARAVAVLPTGEILAAGIAPYGTSAQQFLVVRFTAAGAPDTSFAGGQAYVLTPVYNAQTIARSICVSPSGKFYVTGFSNKYYAMAGYLGTPLDVTPDGISFTDASGVPLVTEQTSNLIVVGGLDTNAQVPVRVTNGTYSINGAAYTSAPGWAKNSDTIAVRHTSAATPATPTTTTLSVGGVSPTNNLALVLGTTATATFTSTTAP